MSKEVSYTRYKRGLLLMLFLSIYSMVSLIAESSKSFAILYIPFWLIAFYILKKNRLLRYYGISKPSFGSIYSATILITLLLVCVSNVIILIVNGGFKHVTDFHYVIVLLSASFGEELLFRGALLNFLKNRNISFKYIIIITSVMFAVFHLVNITFQGIEHTLAQLVFALACGLCLGVLSWLTNSIVLCFLFHFLINISANDISDNYALILIISLVLLIISSTVIYFTEKKNEVVH